MGVVGLVIQLFLLLAPCENVVSLINWARIPLTFILRWVGIDPTVERLGYMIKGMLLIPLIGMHTWEVVYQLGPVLRRFNVEGSGVRMCWVSGTDLGHGI